MRFINDQCKQCPFRPKSAPGWLGSYDVGSVFRSIWKGFPFFCHSVINYKAKTWEATAMKKGKLCLGGLVFAHKIHAPDAEIQHEPIREARKLALVIAPRIECMDAKAFGEHHSPEGMLRVIREAKR